MSRRTSPPPPPHIPAPAQLSGCSRSHTDMTTLSSYAVDCIQKLNTRQQSLTRRRGRKEGNIFSSTHSTSHKRATNWKAVESYWSESYSTFYSWHTALRHCRGCGAFEAVAVSSALYDMTAVSCDAARDIRDMSRDAAVSDSPSPSHLSPALLSLSPSELGLCYKFASGH